MPSLRRHEGYLLIDHSASPGTAEVPSGTRLELPHFTCPHCNGVVIMNPQRTRPRGYCAKCDHWTCDKIVCATECNPIIQSVGLAQRYPESAQSFLLRGPNGEILFDPRLKEKERVY